MNSLWSFSAGFATAVCSMACGSDDRINACYLAHALSSLKVLPVGNRYNIMPVDQGALPSPLIA